MSTDRAQQLANTRTSLLLRGTEDHGSDLTQDGNLTPATGLTIIFGGSFDPVHQGHVATARAVQAQTQAARLVWLPAARSPLKSTTGAGAQARQAMLECMLQQAAEPSWSLDLSELQAPPPSFTITSLQRWRSALGAQPPLAFLIGRDSLNTLESWQQWQVLTDFAHLIIARRPKTDATYSANVTSWLENRQISSAKLLQSRPFGAVLELETPPWPISSSELRRMLAISPESASEQDSDEQSGESSLAHWLDAGVRDYIKQHGLYRLQENPASS